VRDTRYTRRVRVRHFACALCAYHTISCRSRAGWSPKGCAYVCA